MMVFAQFERETIQRRVTDNYYARARTGMYLGGRPPFGFNKGETVIDGKRTACFVPHPEQAALMIEIFERYAQDGESLGSLVRWLNMKGYTTVRGGSWSTMPLGRLLRNPAFVRADAAVYRYFKSKNATMNDPIEKFDQIHGCYCYAPQGSVKRKFTDLSHSFVTLAPHEGLVDAELWLEVQHKLDRNKALKNSGAGKNSWLSGVMKCAKCGYAISVVNKPSGMAGHYINCGGRKRGICEGRSTVITLEQIETVVAAELLRFLQGYRGIEVQMQQKRSGAINRMEMEIAVREEEIAQLGQNLAQICQPDVVHIIAEQIHAANERLRILREERDALLYRNDSTDLEPCFEAVLREWPDYTIAEKKQIARAAIERVTVDDDRLGIIFRAEKCGHDK
jgi:hypothetical protein